MHREKEIALLAECLGRAKEKKPFMDSDEARVPVDAYVDAARFARERELVFRRRMNLIAHGSELSSPGDFVTRDVLSTPVVIVRGEDGRVRAFLNVCRHRGATVELRERGTCRRFVCPYHGWTYRPDGALDQVRHKEGFPKLEMAASSLVALSCIEERGFG